MISFPIAMSIISFILAILLINVVRKVLGMQREIATLYKTIKNLQDRLEARDDLLKRILKERMLFTPHAKYRDVLRILQALYPTR
jgi:cell division protein FtsL